MYIRITSRCNMSCPHCCYNCTTQGQDMTLETFRKVLTLCSDHGSIPFIGGGEPTLHPKFEQFLLEAIATAAEIGDGPVGIITNGSIRRRAMMIAKLTKAEIISGSLSQDQYHDPIDIDVIDAFGDNIWDTSKGGTRDPLPHGRGKNWYDKEYIEEGTDPGDCCCSNWVVDPDGKIHQCGCDDSPIIGNANDGINSPISGECWKSTEFVRACEDHDAMHILG